MSTTHVTTSNAGGAMAERRWIGIAVVVAALAAAIIPALAVAIQLT